MNIKTNNSGSNSNFDSDDSNSSLLAIDGTQVVCVRVKNIRPEYDNLEKWMEDTKSNEYIGRKGVVFIDGKRFPPNDSMWSNPYKITDECERNESIKLYEEYIENKIKKYNLVPELLNLRGKKLGCWCIGIKQDFETKSQPLPVVVRSL